MHTYKMPKKVLTEWLTEYPSEVDPSENYEHLLLEQKIENNESLVKAFRPYFESAHLDAREVFHSQIGIDLHPDATSAGVNAVYPNCLGSNVRKGLFGEVMAGMLTEAYSFVGKHEWQIPVFLFRCHADVETYLFTLARDSTRAREVFGRFGADFLAIALDQDGQVVRYLSGEAKWRQSLTSSVVNSLMLGAKLKGTDARSNKGIWNQLNVDTKIPHAMRQLQKILKEKDPNGYAAAILSMDKAMLLSNPNPIKRTNLIILCGNATAKRKEGTCSIGHETKPEEYTAAHDLQVIELILSNGSELIKSIYDCLWCVDK